MNKIRIDKYKHGYGLHIGRLGIEAGWFPGESFSIFKIDVCNYLDYPRTLYILGVRIIYAGFTIWIEME